MAKMSGALGRAIKKLLALVDRPKHTIDPDDNILLGVKAIIGYLDLKRVESLVFWVENFGFPAIKRPDNGMWMSSITAIDHWLFMMAAAEARLREEKGLTKSGKDFNRFKKFRDKQIAHATERRKELQPPETIDPPDTPVS